MNALWNKSGGGDQISCFDPDLFYKGADIRGVKVRTFPL